MLLIFSVPCGRRKRWMALTQSATTAHACSENWRRKCGKSRKRIWSPSYVITERTADFGYFVETKNKNLATVGNILAY